MQYWKPYVGVRATGQPGFEGVAVALPGASCIAFFDLISFAGGHARPPGPPTEEIS